MIPKRIAIVGPGAVGCFFAAHLSGTGHEVVACARRPFSTYEIESESAPFSGPAVAVIDPADLDQPFDFVLVGVKAHQTAGAAAWLERACDPDTVVVAMQNGVEAVDRLQPFVNGATVLASVVYCGAELVEPGHVRHHSAGRLILPTGPAADSVAALFESTAAHIDVTDTYATSAWVKLGINVAANGLTALTDQPMGVLAHPNLIEVAAALLRETWTVGRADGADLDLGDLTGRIRAIAERAPDGGTSMLADMRAGRPTEHDAIHGAVVRAGLRHGIATPIVDVVHAILAARGTHFEDGR